MAHFPIKTTLELILTNSTYLSFVHPVGDLSGAVAQNLAEKANILIILYYDEFEIVNPIGSYRKKHKLGGFYFSIANLDARHKSKLAAIHPIALLKYAALDDDILKASLAIIVDDINSVEKFMCGSAQYNVRTLAVIGDSPASAAIGLFQFSCAFLPICVSLYENISNSIHFE